MLGFGINVNVVPEEMPAHLQNTAASLRAASGQIVSRAKLLATILNHLEKTYLLWCEKPTLETMLDEWKKASVLDGKTITILNGEEKVTGKVLGITPQGALILKDDQGKNKIILAGDAHLGTENLARQL